MCLKRFTFTLVFVSIILFGCGNKIDDEAIQNLSDALVKRWDYTETLPKEVTKEELLKTIEIELETLNDYNVDDFKDALLGIDLSSYRSTLNLINIQVERLEINNSEFHDKWNKHLADRAYILYEINQKYDLNIPEEYTWKFEDALSYAEPRIVEEKIKKEISTSINLDNLEIKTNDNSIAVFYETEVSFSDKSFVATKLGFPSQAIEILKVVVDFNFDDIVIATTNNDVIAASAYFDKTTLKQLDFTKWDKLDSVDAYKFYDMTTAYHIRLGIWENLDGETKKQIGDMNKRSDNFFWNEYGIVY